ncbi:MULTISPECIES: type II secretion system F family protein [unclassified Pseudomonas]|uniref:type II secretion system F family protein n=1 Tax=unclassified Pseudomonas TaxID=196821 RepID=UPI0021BAAA35|nr:type II secretion system F family protein [Pseudomonas sp. HD6422]MCT8164788.1 type II secretion system F family protein [Pseudomonas sp. HD6422]MCT8181324.1 type II secretion system F family protein [Pseudomonas sp. HD6421]
MMGPLLLSLSVLLLGCALLLLRLGLHKRGEERVLQRRGRALEALRTPATRQRWLDARLQRAGLDPAGVRLRPWALGWLGGVALGLLLGSWWVALLLSLGIPLAAQAYLTWRYRRRMRRIIEQLPGLLDYSVRSLKAGRTLTDAVLGGLENTREPLRAAMQRVQRNVQLGVPLEDALSELAELYGQDELRVFALGLRINQRYGGNASELMENLIKLIREREQGGRQLRAMTGETRVTAWILGALPLLMVGYFLLGNPGYLLAMWQDQQGQWLLGFAFAFQALGCLVLWRMMRSL